VTQESLFSKSKSMNIQNQYESIQIYDPKELVGIPTTLFNIIVEPKVELPDGNYPKYGSQYHLPTPPEINESEFTNNKKNFDLNLSKYLCGVINNNPIFEYLLKKHK
jgi:hypothetical protein